jgi:hypothetical protein
LGAEADTGGRYRETQRRSDRSPGRSGVARSARGPRPRNFYARPAETPEALAALQKAEIAKWWPIIKEAGIKAQ